MTIQPSRGVSTRWRATSNRALDWALRICVVLCLSQCSSAVAQFLGSNCTATLLNHSVQLNPNGTFNLPNIPSNPGMYRIHVVCTNSDGTTSEGLSDFIALTPNGSESIPLIQLGPVQAVPLTIAASVDSAQLGTAGATTQVHTIGTLPDGSFEDESGSPGTTYISSNSAIATVSSSGLVTAVSAGLAVITVRYDGLLATTSVNVSALLDSDGDGMPDEWEIANGLNPFDPSDAGQDPDGDGLTNLQEYKLGTNPHVADTDGDGLSDGEEVKLGTNPLVADTDGDGLTDGQEVALGTNPLNADTDGDGIPDGIEVKIGTNPLVPDPTTIATGHVVDTNGKPVAGAAATIFTYFTGTTDATGTFTIPFVPTDLTALIAQVLYVAPGGAVYNGTSQSTAGVAAGTTDLGVIQLGTSTGVVQGTVSSPTGKPVSGAQVVVSGSSVQLSALTDATGSYRVTNLPAGTIVVTALDPVNGLRGTVTGTLGGSPLTLNIALAGYGTVTGSVTEPNGSQAPAGVTVQLSGSASLSTTTDALGHYTFPFVPVGAFTVQASDSSSHQGAANGLVAATSQTVTANIQFSGTGTVSGTVQDQKGNPAANAQVALQSNTAVQQQVSGQADANGHYSFSNVVMGAFTVSAWVPQSRQGYNELGGTAQGTIAQDQQTVTLNVTVNSAGSGSGVVYRSDGKTPAQGVKVAVANTAISATTDANGNYEVDFVPPGAQRLAAQDPNTGDQGAASVTITAGQLAQIPAIDLNGLGTAVVTVNDASGNPVPSAQVTVISNTQFAQQLTGLTNSAGQYTFGSVLAGGVTVNASGPNSLAGTAQGTVPINGSAAITVALQPAGTIQGQVFTADGQTPAAAVTVQIDGAQTTVSDGGGNYEFTTVPSGAHLLQALDGSGQPESTVQKATIASQGQTVTANITLIGLGTVTGKITNADGSPAVGAAIKLTSADPGFVQTFETQSDVNGNYTLSNIPVGTVTVSALAPTGMAAATAQLPSNGATITVNLQLGPNAALSAHTFFDANGFTYDIDSTGEIQSGTNSVFAGIAIPFPGRYDETLSLTLSGGATTYFSGSPTATTTQSGYEYDIEQDGIGGLNVIRRIYVPPTGYMARYIETLVNPTSAAITVDVNLHSGYRYTHETRNGYTYNGTPGVVASSSGDSSFNVTTDPATSDQWIIEGTDLDVDPFLDTNNVPAVAYIFDDGQSPAELTAGSFETTSNHGEMSATYGGVTIPAGKTVELMHFVSQQAVRASAQATAQRLIQLPPEALAGLTGADAANIANFRVPMNLTSALAALPGLGGTVTGSVIAGDNTTPVAGALVSLQSTDLLYSRTYQVNSGSDGTFIFQNNNDGLSDAVAIPLEAANISAVHPVSQVTSPQYTVPLSSNNPFLSQSVVFSNTGQITGTVSLTPTEVVTAGTISVTSPSLLSAPTIPIHPDGTYTVTGLPAATYNVTATIAGTILTGSTTATVVDGQSVTANILIGANGTIQGQVIGVGGGPLADITVYLRTSAGQSLSTLSGTGGNFAFNDVPPGNYTLQAYDPASNTGASAAVTVTQGGTSTQNLTLGGGANITGTITGPSGVSVASLPVALTINTASGPQNFTTTSSSSGGFNFTNVPQGAFTVTVQASSGYSGFSGGNLSIAGENAVVNVNLIQAGSIKGTVLKSDGKTPASGIQVQIYGQPNNIYQQSLIATVQTDANGNFSSAQVPVGSFTVVAQNLADGDEGVVTGTIATANQQVTVQVTLSGEGTLNITVLNSNGQPDVGANISVGAPFNRNYTATSSQQGTATIDNVLAGSLQVSATDPTTRLSATKQVTLAAGATQSVTLQLQASATIAGHVYAPDGETPVAGARLTIYGTGTILTTDYGTTTGADGSYQFTGIQLGVYNLVVLDSNKVLRAYAPGLTVTSNGQLLTQDITFSGIGTVQGTVTNPDGSAAANISVQVDSSSKLGGVFNVATDSGGNYKATGVPVGGFSVNAENTAQGYGGSASGTITSDGDVEIVNIQMVSNVVQLTKTLTDANDFKFDVQKDGTIGNGSPYYYLYTYGSTSTWMPWGSPDYNNAFHLALFLDGSENDFIGNQTGTGVADVNGQQISIEQDDLAGLDVTRRIYVPATGYFARYIESLTNPTSSPITVDVQVNGNIQYPSSGGSALVATSSGDSALSTSDQWLVTDQVYGGLNWPLSEPALGEVFAGPGAAQSPAVASLTLPSSQNSLYYPALEYRWNGITIAPGATVEIMHFAVQESLTGQAMNAVQRLVQEPPEIFAGLTANDAADILNFAVPSSLTSTLPALTLPAAGSVSGHVYGADGKSVVPLAGLMFQGSDPIYGSGLVVTADTSGAYSMSAVPVGSFTMTAQEPLGRFISPAENGSFASGATSTTQDVIFSNAALVNGTINVPNETTFTGATVTLLQNNGENDVWQDNIGTSTSFTLPVVPPGSFAQPADTFSIDLDARAPGNNSVSFNSSQAVDPKAGDIVNLTFNLPDTGSLSGNFKNASGAAIPNVFVYIAPAGQSGYAGDAQTDANGNFQFAELAVGNYTLTGTDPVSGLVATASLTITAGAATVQNLQIANGATVNLTVTLNGGGVAANSLITISRSSDNGNYVTAGVTDSSGTLQIQSVPVGAFTVVAYYPGTPIATGSVQASGTGTVASNGQTISLAIALPAVSTLIGVVSSASGTPVPSASINFYYTGITSYYSYVSATTDASGKYSFFPVYAAQPIQLTATGPSNDFSTQVNVTTAASGTLTENITLPVNATLVVKALDANGNPYPNQSVSVEVTVPSPTAYSSSYFDPYGTTAGDGTTTFTGLADGTYGITLYGPNYTFAGSGTVVITTSDDGKTVQATVQAGYTGSIQGTVVAADGVTPAPPGDYTVYLYDADNYSNNYDASDELATVNSTDGTYSFPNITVGRDGYVIVVYPPYFPDASQPAKGQATGKLTAAGQTQTTDTTIAIPVVAGTVYQADGVTPVANPNITASINYSEIYDNSAPVVYTGISSADGTYSVAVPAPAANTSIIAEANGVTSEVQLSVNTGDTVDTQDIILHASGTVQGTVTDTYGDPLLGATISVQSTGSSYTRTTDVYFYNSDGSTNSTGAFMLPNIATGSITITATDGYYSSACTGTATGTLANNGDTLTVQVTINTNSCAGSSGGQSFLDPRPDTNLSLNAPPRVRFHLSLAPVPFTAAGLGCRGGPSFGAAVTRMNELLCASPAAAPLKPREFDLPSRLARVVNPFARGGQ